MACPYFLPSNSGSVCSVGGNVMALCKQGYARGSCAAFPADAAADDVLITAAVETANSLLVRFSVERNYLPVSVGEHQYLFPSAQWSPTIADENIRAQMDAYVVGFLQLQQEQIKCLKSL